MSQYANIEPGWMMDLGQIPIPKSWYKSRAVSAVLPQVVPHKSTPSHKRAILKMKRGIAALVNNSYLVNRDDIYYALKERGFIPLLATKNTLISVQRFYSYYSDVMNERGLKRDKFNKTQFIRDNYLSMSVARMAIEAGTTETYVSQVVSRIIRCII